MKGLFYRNILVICLLSMVAFAACKPKQKIVYSSSPVKEKADSQLFNDIISSEFSYRTFSAKLSMVLPVGTKPFSTKANIRIVKDEALQISFMPLFPGVEMFRLYMNPDTVFMLDKMNKRYVLESIEALKSVYPVGFDYYTIQSLFTNALFISGKSKVEADDYSTFNYKRPSDRIYYITSSDAESGINYSFVVNADDRITFSHLMLPEKEQTMEWEYHDFTVLKNVTFPHKMKVALSSTSRKVEAELLFSDVTTDDTFQLALNVPSGYTKTTVEEVLKILSPKK